MKKILKTFKDSKFYRSKHSKFKTFLAKECVKRRSRGKIPTKTIPPLLTPDSIPPNFLIPFQKFSSLFLDEIAPKLGKYLEKSKENCENIKNVSKHKQRSNLMEKWKIKA